MVFLNDPDDCEWLANIHLGGDFPPFKSFILDGNEDSPLSVLLFEAQEPDVDAMPIAEYTATQDQDGEWSLSRIDI